MFPDAPSFHGLNLAHVVVIIVAIMALYVMLKDSLNKLFKKRKKPTEDDSKPEIVQEAEEVKEKKDKLAKKGWFKFKMPTGGLIIFFIGFIPPVFMTFFAYLVFSGSIEFSNTLMVIVLIIFSVLVFMNPKFRKMRTQTLLIILVFVFMGIYQGGRWLIPELMGTPEPTLMKPVRIASNEQLTLDLSHPRWTGYSISVPDQSWLEISAKGKHFFSGKSTLLINDKSVWCGPEGASFNVAIFNGDEIDWLKPHLPHPDNFVLINAPYAALIGKVGEDGKVFFIGKHRKVFIEEGGKIYLSTNIKWVNPPTGDWKFNWKPSSGVFNIEFTITSDS